MIDKGNLVNQENYLEKCLQTKVETKDGPLIFFHHEPLTKEDISVLKTFTKKEIKQVVVGLGFKIHRIN